MKILKFAFEINWPSAASATRTVLCIAVKVAVSTWNWLKTVTFMTFLCQSMPGKLFLDELLKFRYSEKAKKFWKKFPNLLQGRQ